MTTRPPKGGRNRRQSMANDKRARSRKRRTRPSGRLRTVCRGGKAATASQDTGQLLLFSETADSPRGAVAGADEGQTRSATRAVPKSRNTTSTIPVATSMTMEEVADIGNLMLAFNRVRANDGAPGPDRQTIKDVEGHLGEILPALSRTLLDETYRPGTIRRVWIPKAGGGQRGLGIPDVVDRLVQQAVHQVLSPNYETGFHPSSHGFRPGRSCHTAIAEAQTHLEDGYEWVVDMDLEKFFDRVSHDRLLTRLAQRIADHRLLRLIRRMLKAKVVMPDGVVVSTDEGTPQGGPLSPLLSNIVLDELDHEMARRGYRFVRYADDTNVYVRSKRSGERVMASIVRFIEKKLRLRVNRAKSAVAKPEERHFLGFRLRREPLDGSSEVLLSKRSVDRLDGRIRTLTPRTWGQSLAACVADLNAYLRGWIQFFRICTAAEVRTLHNRDAHIRRRLRTIVLKQWRRKRTIVLRLIRRGVPRKAAKRRVYGKRRSWWALSNSWAVHKGLGTEFFVSRRLISLEERWSVLNASVAVAPAQLRLELG